ncbi:hypothetical protein KY339_04810 [Candidatus Woesearchaeota archaeon]|nr:hypothetical protein [Candidatus Woesearchaeota archaeon]
MKKTNLRQVLPGIMKNCITKMSIFSLFLLLILVLNVATALAQSQSHPLSQVSPTDTNLDMNSYSIINVNGFSCSSCIALGSETSGNYAAGTAEGGAATSGDSATAFFSTGTIESARLPASISYLGSSISYSETDFANQNLLTSSGPTFATINTGFGAKEIGDSVGNCASTDVHKGDGGCEAESSLSVWYATNSFDASNANWADEAGNLTCTDCVNGSDLADNLDLDADLNIDSNTLYIDRTNNRVGIGTNNPQSTLSVGGDGVVSAGIYGYGVAYGVYGEDNNGPRGYLGTTNYGAYGRYDADRYGQLGTANYGVYGHYDLNNYGYIAANGVGVFGTGTTWAGQFEGDVNVSGDLYVSNNVGIGTTNPQSNLSVGGTGYSDTAIYGESPLNSNRKGALGGDVYGVYGQYDTTKYGWIGRSDSAASFYNTESTASTRYGVYASASGGGGGTRYGIYAQAIGTGTNYGGYFVGDVTLTGTLTKGGGSFLIDHPLDPENKVLRHSFVESPDMKNIYDGIITLDGKGEAVVELPSYFDALNKDYRYLLTSIGIPQPNLYVKEKIENNRFVIGGGKPGAEVSWQVTGIRQDAFALENPIIVEEEKPVADIDKGDYLHPEVW